MEREAKAAEILDDFADAEASVEAAAATLGGPAMQRLALRELGFALAAELEDFSGSRRRTSPRHRALG